MRIDRVVVNASPLIALFRSGQESLLPGLFTDIAVPAEVGSEVAEGGHEDAAAQGLGTVDWLTRRDPEPPDPLVMAWDLGPGETAVLSFARAHPDYVAVVDDLAARRCARALNVRILGTGGLLVLAKRRGVIASVGEALESLRRAGLWLSDDLVNLLLAEAGEHE